MGGFFPPTTVDGSEIRPTSWHGKYPICNSSLASPNTYDLFIGWKAALSENPYIPLHFSVDPIFQVMQQVDL